MRGYNGCMEAQIQQLLLLAFYRLYKFSAPIFSIKGVLNFALQDYLVHLVCVHVFVCAWRGRGERY